VFPSYARYPTAPLTTCVRDAASLYNLLTGEKPFREDNAAFHLSKVITNDDVRAEQVLDTVSSADTAAARARPGS